MTLQPAAENRFTVAWPMPRLAPVSSMTLRPALEEEVGNASPGKRRAKLLRREGKVHQTLRRPCAAYGYSRVFSQPSPRRVNWIRS
jgi:hypothetical protein